MKFETTLYHPQKGDKLHIGIIPDGGRRWAIKNEVSLIESYIESRELLLDIITYLFSQNVSEISIYLSSIQNFKRTLQETTAFCDVITSGLQDKYLKLAQKLKFKIRVVGETSILPENLKEVIEDVQLKTEKYNDYRLNLCIAYNPINEISKAIAKTQNDESFIEYLGITVPLNIIIRTGDANLLSNFLPLQSGFARIYFEKKLFNDMSLDNIKSNYKEYSMLNLKYGE